MKAFLFTIICLPLFGTLWGQNALKEAELLSNQYEYQASSECLLAFIADHPERKYDLGRAWSLHSYNLLKQGQSEEARSANAQSLQLRRQLRSPEITENYLRSAQIDLAAERYGDALMAAEQGMQMMIENPRVYADLNFYAAKALWKLGRKEEAEQYFSTARDVVLIEVGAQDRAYAELLLEGAKLYLEEGAFEQAFSQLVTAYYSATDPLLRAKFIIAAWRVYPLMK